MKNILIAAIKSGSIEAVDICLKRKPDLSIVDQDGDSLLMLAVKSGDLEICIALLATQYCFVTSETELEKLYLEVSKSKNKNLKNLIFEYFGLDKLSGRNNNSVDVSEGISERSVDDDVLSRLTPREKEILSMRFGIEMSPNHTLEEVQKQFDITRERIRQIETGEL
jgi:ankyrin repeat protein